MVEKTPAEIKALVRVAMGLEPAEQWEKEAAQKTLRAVKGKSLTDAQTRGAHVWLTR